MDRAMLAATLRSLGLGAAGFLVVALGLTSADEPLDRSRPVGYAESLVAAHDCWTGEAPEESRGLVPGHVVVTVDGATRYAGEHLTGLALEQLFGDADHGLTVHGFCR